MSQHFNGILIQLRASELKKLTYFVCTHLQEQIDENKPINEHYIKECLEKVQELLNKVNNEIIKYDEERKIDV